MEIVRLGFALLVAFGLRSHPWLLPPPDSNILHPIPEIERRLQYEVFEIKEVARFTQLELQARVAKVKLPWRVTLRFPDGVVMQVKWKTAERGGEAFNNQPRYEIAAYLFQKLYLTPDAYVVPPTVGRGLPVQQYRSLDPHAKPTFKHSDDVFFVLQYWLANVTAESDFDPERFESDSLYARHFANLNLFCHLIWHSDANAGNVLASTDPENPRWFSVDNGIAFGKAESQRGTHWRSLKVKRFPRATVARLRRLTRARLDSALGVVAQYRIEDRRLVVAEKSANLNPRKGVRQTERVVQLGLTANEIKGVFERIQKFLRKVDEGKYRTF